MIGLFQKQFDLGLSCLSRPFLEATNVQKFRTYTVICILFSMRALEATGVKKDDFDSGFWKCVTKNN